jgi:hypothetical protein
MFKISFDLAANDELELKGLAGKRLQKIVPSSIPTAFVRNPASPVVNKSLRLCQSNILSLYCRAAALSLTSLQFLRNQSL